VVVDNRSEIRQFLASRRARITPEQAGLPIYGGNRRVAGLRPEEVALLTGVSVDYYTRLDPRATNFFVEWDRVANDVVATLRSQAGRDPYDRALVDLVGELSTRSEEFRTRWAAHNVRHHRTGRKHLHHPVVGELQLTYEVMDLLADPGLSLVVYSAEPRFRLPGRPEPPRQLGGDPRPARPGGDGPGARRTVTRGVHVPRFVPDG
jgi:MmyB-like transcription regulator ligand binding domain